MYLPTHTQALSTDNKLITVHWKIILYNFEHSGLASNYFIASALETNNYCYDYYHNSPKQYIL